MANEQTLMQQRLARSQKLNRERQQSRRNPASPKARRAKKPRTFLDRTFDPNERPGENLQLGEHEKKAKLTAQRMLGIKAKNTAQIRSAMTPTPGGKMPMPYPRSQQDTPFQPKTREGQSAQRAIDRELPESRQPRGTQDVDPTTVTQLQMQMGKLKQRQAMAKNKESKAEIGQIIEKQKARIRKAVKRKAEAAMKRGIIYVVDLIAGCCDLGTLSITLLIDIFIYMFTFGWLNLELVYGRWFRDGKDILISPLSWDPIPVPVDPEANVLMGILVAADLALLFLLGGMFLIGMCVTYDYYLYSESPSEFAIMLATSPSDACTGDIILQAFGL